jgi:hypothetical protein
VADDDPVEREPMFPRFRRLILEVISGETKRTVFEPWEVDLLTDIESCVVPPARRIGALRRYLTAVERQLKRGPGPPMKFSEFLAGRNKQQG